MCRRFPESAARITFTTIAATAIVLLHAFPPLDAQTRPASTLIRVLDVEIAPDSIAEWTRLHRQEILPAYKKGGLPWMDVWTSAGAGNPYLRTLVSPISSLAELDRPGALQRALGTEGAEALLERNRELLASVRSYIMRARPDLGFGTITDRAVGMLSTVTVHAGRGEEFEQALKQRVLDSLKASNVANYLVLQVEYGGDPNQYRTLMSFPTHAEAENLLPSPSAHPDPIAWMLGSHGPQGVERLARERGSPIAHVERTIIRYLPELSFRPPAPAADTRE